MMEVRVTQGFQTWRVPSANGEGLALELAGGWKGACGSGPGSRMGVICMIETDWPGVRIAARAAHITAKVRSSAAARAAICADIRAMKSTMSCRWFVADPITVRICMAARTEQREKDDVKRRGCRRDK
jgi:hypothetical protein